jgi:hypothetical protein
MQLLPPMKVSFPRLHFASDILLLEALAQDHSPADVAPELLGQCFHGIARLVCSSLETPLYKEVGSHRSSLQKATSKRYHNDHDTVLDSVAYNRDAFRQSCIIQGVKGTDGQVLLLDTPVVVSEPWLWFPES